MKRVGEIIINQSKVMLENKQQAILYAVILSIIPFASWLSVALMILVTLRKGAKIGFEVMLPALVVHSVPLMMLVPVDSAIANTVIAYIPCYFAALVLRNTNSWQAVSGVICLQALLAIVLVQVIAPDFVMDQFNQFKSLLAEYKEYQQILDSTSIGLNDSVLGQLFFGIQILTVIISAFVSLLFARSVQAKLFMPGGLQQEISAFRSGKIALLGLVGVLLASYYDSALAINLLPLMLCYFLVSGFNLAYYTLAGKKQMKIFVLLALLIFLKPSLVLFAYIILGSLDSIFNLRLYLPIRVKEST